MEKEDILGLIGMICGIASAGLLLGAFISLAIESGKELVGGGGRMFLSAALFVSIPGLVLSIIGVAKEPIDRTKFGVAGIIISSVVLGIALFMNIFGFVLS